MAEMALSGLLQELRSLIQGQQQRIVSLVNSELITLYWEMGRKIRAEILRDERAEYGERVLEALASTLSHEFGTGFSKRNLHYMIRFAECFPDNEIVHALRSQLSWTHIRELIGLKDDRKRTFYAEMARIQRWSTRKLKAEIEGMLYERVALSREPEVVVDAQLAALQKSDVLTPDMIFRDPYLLSFLGLPPVYSELELEQAILRELESFLEELGGDFCFVARQKRMTVGPDDFYLDLLFFHRRLRRLVAIELKLGRFMPADVGQMLLYLRLLDQHERLPGEEAPLGLILCSEADRERVELLELADGSIRVAQYLTALPPIEVLSERLHKAIARAKIALARA